MAELILNPTTKVLIDTFLKRPSHGLLLSGKPGVGLHTISHEIAHSIDAHSRVHEVLPDEKHTIAIETVRGLYRLTRAGRDQALVVIIDESEGMGREAQNALLKLLEEPNANVFFILTTHYPQQLLPTITSRLQHIEVLPPSNAQTAVLIPADTDPATKAQLDFIAAGLPAELKRLLADQTYFTARAGQMKDARRFLEGDTYERLLLVKSYSSDRTMAVAFLNSITHVLTFMLFAHQRPELIRSLQLIEEVNERLQHNTHLKMQLTYLVTALAPSGTMVS